MIIASILTPYTGKGTEADPFRPLVADTYKLRSFVDVTPQTVFKTIPPLNIYLIRAFLEQSELTKIDNDPNYLIVSSYDNA